MPLPAFKDEAEFRTNWIAPFLSKLGYIQVSHIHGSGEQGKDFFFADYDRFEHRRFYAVQAKNGKIGAGGTELDGLLNQVQRSFTVKLRFHKDANEQHVSAV
jgi:Restriction endonuclease